MVIDRVKRNQDDFILNKTRWNTRKFPLDSDGSGYVKISKNYKNNLD